MSTDALVSEVLAGFQRRGWTLAIAESCTGGELSSWLTAPPGSSAVVVGAVVPYADRAKVAVLGVSPELIARHGAVSVEVAQGMADGVRSIMEATVGIAITGIAGPSGARPGKPVGLTCFALSGADGLRRTELCQWHGQRSDNRVASVAQALHMLLDLVNAT